MNREIYEPLGQKEPMPGANMSKSGVFSQHDVNTSKSSIQGENRPLRLKSLTLTEHKIAKCTSKIDGLQSIRNDIEKLLKNKSIEKRKKAVLQAERKAIKNKLKLAESELGVLQVKLALVRTRNKTAHDEFTRLKKDPEYLKSAVDKYNELNKKNKQLESDINKLSSKSKLTFREKRELTRKKQDLKACKKEKSQLEFKVLKIFILSEFRERYIEASAAFAGIPKSELKSLVHSNEMFNIASLGPNLNRTNLATGKSYTLQEFMATKAGNPENPVGSWEPREFFHNGQKLTAYVFTPKNVGPGQFSQLYLPSPIKTADDVVGDIMNGHKDLEPKARATKQLEEFEKLAGEFCPLVQDAPDGASPEEKVKLTKFAATASILNDENDRLSEAFEIAAPSEKAVLTQAVTGRGTTMAREVYKQIERLRREISS